MSILSITNHLLLSMCFLLRMRDILYVICVEATSNCFRLLPRLQERQQTLPQTKELERAANGYSARLSCTLPNHFKLFSDLGGNS